MELYPEVFVEPKAVDVGDLTEEEVNVFSERAGEINYLLEGVYSRGAGAAAELAIYAFKLGREFEKGQE